MKDIAALFDTNREFAGTLDRADVVDHDPDYVSVCCCDARVPQESLFDTAPGTHFTVANIGNSVRGRDEAGEPMVSGSVLYPVLETDADVVLVVGHTGCGAVTAAYEWVARGAEPGRPELRADLELLRPYVEEGLELVEEALDDDETIARLAEYNVDRQVETLEEAVDDVRVLGGICDLHDLYPGRRGTVHLVNVGGERQRGDIPDALTDYFHRHLDY